MSDGAFKDLISGHGFDRVQHKLQSSYTAWGLECTLTYCPPSPDPALCLDFETAKHVGQVTLWESGPCDMEVLDEASGEIAFYEHHEFNKEEEFLAAYLRLVVFMRDALSGTKQCA